MKGFGPGREGDVTARVDPVGTAHPVLAGRLGLLPAS